MRNAECTAPRSNSGEGDRCNEWCNAFAVVNAWWTVSQSPKSFCVWKRVRRNAGRVRDGLTDLFLGRARAQRVEQGVDDGFRVVGEELPREPGNVGECASLRVACRQRVVDLVVRAADERGQIVRMPPLASLFAARRAGGLRDERREHRRRGIGANQRDGFERLVREVERVAFVDEHVVGDGREHHRLDRVQIGALGQRGREHAFGRVAGACVDEAPVPLGEPVGRNRGRRQCRDREARRLRRGIACDEHERVDECGGLLVRIELVDHVRHRDQHGEAGTPPCGAIRGAEVEARAHDLRGRHAQVEEREHRFGDDERQALLEPVAQPALPARDLVAFGTRTHVHVVAVELDVEALRVVGPEVEGAARLEIEPRVVPVARDQAGLDGSLMQREAHVRAPVLDGEAPAVVPEHDHREVADLGDQLPGLAELLGRAGPLPRGDHVVSPSFTGNTQAVPWHDRPETGFVKS